MQRPLVTRNTRDLVTGILLVALLLRSLIPIGFMPSGERPFLLQICRGGFLATLDPQGVNPPTRDHASFEHCPYGSAPAAGPIAHVTTPIALRSVVIQAASRFESLQLAAPRHRAHQTRGPPSFS